ncbi:hemolysin III family protein [bacterium]|nr:hemolysin III family protein [bacterium]
MQDCKKYTVAEEFLNAATHAFGVLLSIYGLVMLIVNSNNAIQATTTAIYGASTLILFQSSTLYHAIANEKAKRVFQRIDHSAIFILIAGTYTPVLMLVVPFPHSVALLASVWYIAIMGIVFSCITLKYKILSTILYLILGWLSIFLFYFVWVSPARDAVWLMLAGGIVYSLGCVFYLMKRKFCHGIWHLFVLAGAVLHYFCIMMLLHKL